MFGCEGRVPAQYTRRGGTPSSLIRIAAAKPRNSRAASGGAIASWRLATRMRRLFFTKNLAQPCLGMPTPCVSRPNSFFIPDGETSTCASRFSRSHSRSLCCSTCCGWATVIGVGCAGVSEEWLPAKTCAQLLSDGVAAETVRERRGTPRSKCRPAGGCASASVSGC